MAFANGWLALNRAIWPWVKICTLASVVVSVVATFLPMWIGIRTFRRQEFH